MYVDENQGLWADLIPLRVMSGEPKISGKPKIAIKPDNTQFFVGWNKQFFVGLKTHITGAVEISPAVEILVITPVGRTNV